MKRVKCVDPYRRKVGGVLPLFVPCVRKRRFSGVLVGARAVCQRTVYAGEGGDLFLLTCFLGEEFRVTWCYVGGSECLSCNRVLSFLLSLHGSIKIDPGDLLR